MNNSLQLQDINDIPNYRISQKPLKQFNLVVIDVKSNTMSIVDRASKLFTPVDAIKQEVINHTIKTRDLAISFAHNTKYRMFLLSRTLIV